MLLPVSGDGYNQRDEGAVMMHSPVQYKPWINAGNIITLALMFGSFIYGYSQLSAEVKGFAAYITKLESRDEQLNTQINTLRDLTATRQLDITAKMSRMEAILERIDGRVDNISKTQDRLAPK